MSSFLNSIIEAFQPKPAAQPQQPEPKLGPADLQHRQIQDKLQTSKLLQDDSKRRAALAHLLNTEERRKLTEQRDDFLEARNRAGKPLNTTERHIVDCELELALAQKSYDRDHGKPFVLGDGSLQMSKQKSRLVNAERALKSAKDALERVRLMTSPGGAASTYAPGPDVSGYLDHKAHVANEMANLKK
jgi:hypothetical protein